MLSTDDAIATLMDHRAEEVELTVDGDPERAPMGTAVLAIRGELRHWRDNPAANEAWGAHGREDIRGLFGVGQAMLDVTEMPAALMLVDAESEVDYGITFDLGGASVDVIWGLDR